MIRFETFKRLSVWGWRYYFRIVSAGNNEIICPSEAYTRPAARDYAIDLIRRGALNARVIEGHRA